MLKNNTPAFAANVPTDPAGAAERSAYQGSMLLTANRTADTDTWRSGLNNNVLVLGSSGCGKTRNHLKPNLLQAQGSYIVLDSKGILYREMAPYLRKQGYQVDQLDFVGMNGTLGYNPLDHIRCQDGHPAEQDIIAIASALCPREDHESDPFWALAAANYLTSYIAYVLEAMPEQDRTMAEVIRVFDEACSGHAERLFDELERKNPGSYAVKLRRRAQTTIRAERMHASIVGIIAASLLPLGFTGAMAAYQCPRRVDFHEFGRKRCALFVTIDDMDTSLRPLTSLFIRQAFSSLCDAADHGSPDGRLAVPVRLMLDDFANLNVANFDNILSVTRSREISCTIVCQTVSQLEARYG
ncbi:MAG: type IV secretory system conjugative DNA transfer family protein, partial [Senegalimassilia anaerobia]